MNKEGKGTIMGKSELVEGVSDREIEPTEYRNITSPRISDASSQYVNPKEFGLGLKKDKRITDFGKSTLGQQIVEEGSSNFDKSSKQ